MLSETFPVHGHPLGRHAVGVIAVVELAQQNAVELAFRLKNIISALPPEDSRKLGCVFFTDIQDGFFPAEFITRVIGDGVAKLDLVEVIKGPEISRFLRGKIELLVDISDFKCLHLITPGLPYGGIFLRRSLRLRQAGRQGPGCQQ